MMRSVSLGLVSVAVLTASAVSQVCNEVRLIEPTDPAFNQAFATAVAIDTVQRDRLARGQ